MKKQKKLKDYYPKKQIVELEKKFKACLNSTQGGFMIIGNLESKIVSDIYNNMCAEAVLDAVAFVVRDAVKTGLLKDKCKK